MGGICSFQKLTTQEEFIGTVASKKRAKKGKKKTVRFKEVVKVIRTSDSWNCDKCRNEIGQTRSNRTAPDTDSTINQVIQKLWKLPTASEQ